MYDTRTRRHTKKGTNLFEQKKEKKSWWIRHGLLYVRTAKSGDCFDVLAACVNFVSIVCKISKQPANATTVFVERRWKGYVNVCSACTFDFCCYACDRDALTRTQLSCWRFGTPITNRWRGRRSKNWMIHISDDFILLRNGSYCLFASVAHWLACTWCDVPQRRTKSFMIGRCWWRRNYHVSLNETGFLNCLAQCRKSNKTKTKTKWCIGVVHMEKWRSSFIIIRFMCPVIAWNGVILATHKSINVPKPCVSADENKWVSINQFAFSVLCVGCQYYIDDGDSIATDNIDDFTIPNGATSLPWNIFRNNQI